LKELLLIPVDPGPLEISMLRQPSLAAFCRFRSNVSLQTLLDDLSVQPAFVERRNGTRIAKKLVLSIEPLDAQLRNAGPTFRATTRDFSAGGIGFIHDNVFPTKWIRVSPFEGCHCQSIAEVRYEHPYPEAGGYLIGVAFVEPGNAVD
jgi:c-di-GMP-binding flagellar brake protein YcgR